MLLVTGATGGLGRAVIDSLLTTTPAAEIGALVRDINKATELAEKGVQLRQADYFDYPALVQALRGFDKVLLVSAVAFTDRIQQHRNVIDAAQEAGVKHVFYTSMQRDSDFVMPQVTESDLATEAYLKASGLAYTILRNGYYMEGLGYMIGSGVPETELSFPAGEGKIAFIKRTDLAAATATLLTADGHEGREYTLCGNEAYSLHDVARELSALAGHPILYKSIEAESYIARAVGAGLPEAVARFLAQWGDAAEHGMLAGTNDTVEQLLGRKPTTLGEYLKTAYFPAE